MVYIIKYIQVNKKRGSKYMERKQAKDLLDFIYDSPTAFHAVETVKKILDENGFKEIKESDKWDLKSRDKYYVIKNDSSIMAFVVGDENIEETGLRLIGAHTDAPGFRVKPNPQMISEGKYVKLNTEMYGQSETTPVIPDPSFHSFCLFGWPSPNQLPLPFSFSPASAPDLQMLRNFLFHES